MRIATPLLIAAVALGVAVGAAYPAAQDPPPAGGGRGRPGAPAARSGRGGVGQGGPGRGRGPNFPQQQRPLADAAVLARGKGLYESNCAACHGVDLRGGQLGGPNLLRSQLVLSDKAGELIAPVVKAGRLNPPAGAPPMPPFPLPDEDITAIAEYLHSVLAQAGRQGRPPEAETVPPEKVLVGDAAAGQAYFTATCSSCHSISGDLKGLAARAADPRELQNLWVSGGGGGRGGRGGGGDTQRRVTVTVTSGAGARAEGRLVRMDDFIVVLIQDDGTRRTFVRKGNEPKVDVRDPSDAHRTLVPTLADRDMHNVTAYLWTLK
jgi:cytochrome c oxidase cbb3-type subunit III